MKSTATDHMNAKENLPSEWRTVTLGELNPYITSGSRGWAKNYSEFGQPFIRITNLSRESIYIDLSDLKRVTIPNDDSEGIRTQLRQGDLLISITADIGIIGYVDESISTPAYINQHIALARFDPEIVDTKYLAYYLASATPQQRFHASTDQGAKAGMNLTGVRAIQAELPPIEEQRAIASALSDMDALLAKLNQLIAKKRDIKQAAMQALLTGRRRLPGFDRKWERRPLGQMLIERPSYGINAPAAPYTLSLPTYIRITDITDDGKFSSANPASVSHPSWAEYKLSEGDIVLARTGASTGKSYRYKKSDGTLIYAGFLIRIRPDPAQLNSAFLECHLNSTEYWKWVQQTSMRSGQPGINGNEYARLSIPLPSIEEQTAIASILVEMGEEITALEARQEKTRLIKQGMMQELLSGRVRLI